MNQNNQDQIIIDAIRESPIKKDWAIEKLHTDVTLKAKAIVVIKKTLPKALKNDEAVHEDIFIKSLYTFCKKVNANEFKEEGEKPNIIFIKGICRNLSLNRFPKKLSKVRTLRQDQGSENNLESLKSLSQQPDEFLIENESSVKAVMDRIIGQLDEECRFILIHYKEGWNIKDIANLIEVSPQTARKYIGTCLDKMKALLLNDPAGNEIIKQRVGKNWPTLNKNKNEG